MNNPLVVTAHSSGTTRVADPAGELIKATNIKFSTGYPGGLYLDASFYVARDVVEAWEIKGTQRIVILDGTKFVYEGEIDDLRSILQQTEQGIRVTVTGYWGALMMRRRWRKLWADTRINNNVWHWQEAVATYTGAEKCTMDRHNRLRFTPKNEAWGNGEFAGITYTMPTGETISKITYDYDFVESAGANDWELLWYDATNGASSIASATGSAASQTYTPGTPVQAMDLRYYARDAQTPESDGSYYGEISNVTVYSETSNINLTEIAKDIRAKLSGESVLNSTDDEIATITYAAGLVPFIADNWDTMANTLMKAASFGDDTNNHWAVGIKASDVADSFDGLPVLYIEQYPALTDWDYAIRFDESNLIPPVKLVENFDDIWNWIIVSYRDAEGKRNYVTPDDDANLTDATSVSDYGQRDYLLNLGNSTSTDAINSGKRFLATYKDPQWVLKSPIKIKGYIRDKNSQHIPCSQIQAGKRIKIENYSDEDLIFRISRTSYDDEKQQTTINAGKVDDLIYPRWVAPPYVPGEEDETGAG